MIPAPLTQPLHILRIPSTSLSAFPRLDELVALINNAFITSWHTIDGLVGDNATRYDSSEQFVYDMGDSGVTWVAFDGSEKGRIVATAGYKSWNAKWKVLERLGQRDGREREVLIRGEKEQKQDAEVQREKFELVVVAVDPSLQKLGLASRMCGEVEMELIEKLRKIGEEQLHLMIRTGKENNVAYWTRKGYRTVSEMRFPVGDFGSKTGFTILDMERVIEI